jgi:hypothetical protein
MTGSDGHIRTYEYNSLNQLIKLSNDYPANSPSRDDVMLNEFDSRGQWAKGTLTVASSGSNTYVVNRDSQGNRSRIDMVNPTTNQVVATHSYIYSDGNLVKYVSRGNSAISQDSLVTTFQHFTDREDKFEPIAESMGHAYGYETLSKNLISKEILTQYNSGSTNGLSSPPIEYSYEFNDKGFPIKITFLYAGTGAKVIYLYEYQCK